MDLPPPPPLITVEELPSEPGCRTLATKTCYKTPIVINKKVRHETSQPPPRASQVWQCNRCKIVALESSQFICNLLQCQEVSYKV